MQGLPYGKVAEILRVARKTVGTRLYRARRLMEEYLDSAPDD
jgi:DNA-directed RNA polymerase specialized sigma24 family protein